MRSGSSTLWPRSLAPAETLWRPPSSVPSSLARQGRGRWNGCSSTGGGPGGLLRPAFPACRASRGATLSSTSLMGSLTPNERKDPPARRPRRRSRCRRHRWDEQSQRCSRLLSLQLTPGSGRLSAIIERIARAAGRRCGRLVRGARRAAPSRGESRCLSSRGPAPTSVVEGSKRGQVQARTYWPDRPIRCRSTDFRPGGSSEAADLSHLVAVERAPDRRRASLRHHATLPVDDDSRRAPACRRGPGDYRRGASGLARVSGGSASLAGGS